jgi:hypothetical protein
VETRDNLREGMEMVMYLYLLNNDNLPTPGAGFLEIEKNVQESIFFFGGRKILLRMYGAPRKLRTKGLDMI